MGGSRKGLCARSAHRKGCLPSGAGREDRRQVRMDGRARGAQNETLERQRRSVGFSRRWRGVGMSRRRRKWDLVDSERSPPGISESEWERQWAMGPDSTPASGETSNFS